MSEITATAIVIVTGVLAAILLWQVLEIGKERARGEGGTRTELAQRVDRLEEGLRALEARNLEQER